MAAVAPQAFAGSTALEPTLAISGDYSTNPQLRTVDAQSGYAAVLEGSLPVSWADGRDLYSLAPRLRLADVGGDESVGGNGYYLGATASRSSDLAQMAAHANWADESLVTAEPAAGTLTHIDVRRTSREADAGWTRNLSPVSAINVGVSAQSLAYAAGQAYGLYDYTNGAVNVQYTRSTSEITQLQVVAGGSRYDSSFGQVVRADSYYAQVGVAGSLTPLWSYQLLYGRSDSRATGQTQSASGPVYLASLTHTGERWTLNASLTQTTQPSGFGTVTNSRETDASAEWKRSERSKLTLTLRSAKTSDSFQSLTYADRTYESVLLGTSWQMSEVWDLNGTVGWQRQRLDFLLAAASGSGLGASVSVARRFGRVKFGGA